MRYHFFALWMVFPESWKRRVADFYAHDCNPFEEAQNMYLCKMGLPRFFQGNIVLKFYNYLITYLSISKGFEVNPQILSQFLVSRIELLNNEILAIRTQTFIVDLDGQQVFLTL